LNSTELDRRTKEKIKEETKKQEAKVTRSDEVWKQCFEKLINMESFELLSLGFIIKTYPGLFSEESTSCIWNNR
jgi:hypothetical protein